MVADVDGDGDYEIVIAQSAGKVSAHNDLAVFEADGTELWSITSGASIGPTSKGGPIHFIDVNNDGAQDIFYLTDNDTLRIVEGSTGTTLHEVDVPPSPHGTYAALPADFDYEPGQESIVFLGKMKKSNHAYPGNQSKLKSRATAITLNALISGGAISWSSDEIRSPAHGLINIVDLDGDGRDEIIGPTIFNYQGDLCSRFLNRLAVISTSTRSVSLMSFLLVPD